MLSFSDIIILVLQTEDLIQSKGRENNIVKGK